jgi:hypothetical protein
MRATTGYLTYVLSSPRVQSVIPTSHILLFWCLLPAVDYMSFSVFSGFAFLICTGQCIQMDLSCLEHRVYCHWCCHCYVPRVPDEQIEPFNFLGNPI